MNSRPMRAGRVGRLARVGLGMLFLWVFSRFLMGYRGVVQPGNLVLYVWAWIGMMSHASGTLIPLFRRTGIRRGTWILLLVLAVGYDFIRYGTWWGTPLKVLLFTLALLGSGVLGLEFTLAGLLGHAGCESTVIPNLIKRGTPPEVRPCPLWDPLDRWEAEKDRAEADQKIRASSNEG